MSDEPSETGPDDDDVGDGHDQHIEQLQRHPGSYLFRHLHAFELIVTRLRKLSAPRILVFGSSWGAEAVPLSLGLPSATISCAEIDPGQIARMRQVLAGRKNIKIIDSDWEQIEQSGPYDAILCNAVLCLHPLPKGVRNLAAHFPYEKYVEIITKFDAMLKPAGVMTLYNCSYPLRNLPVAKHYRVHRVPPTLPFNFTDNVVATCHPSGWRQYVLHDVSRGQVLDVAERYAGDKQQIVSNLNDNIFIKEASDHPANRPTLLKLTRPEGGEMVSFLQSFDRVAPRVSKGFVRVPVETVVRIARQTANGPLYEISHWWDGEALCLPILTGIHAPA